MIESLVDAVLWGTIPPGEHEIEMTLRVPLHDGGTTVRLGLPPQVAVVRVAARAKPETALRVAFTVKDVGVAPR